MRTWRTLGAGLMAAIAAMLASVALAQSPPPLPGQPGAPPAASAPPAGLPAAAGEVWHVEQSGTPYGPMDAATVQSNITSGALTGTNLAWRAGYAGWTPLAAIPEFAGSFAGGGPATPTGPGPAPGAGTPPPLPGSAATGVWFVEQSGQRHGPFDAATVQSNIQSGALTGANLAWRQGMAAWAPLSTIPDFASTLAAAPPPLPTMDASRTQLVGSWESAGGMGMGPMAQRMRITLASDGTYRSRAEMCAQVGGFPICNGQNQSGTWTSQLSGSNQVTIQTTGGGRGGGAPFGPMGGGGGGGISGTWTILDANTLTNASGMMLRRVG